MATFSDLARAAYCPRQLYHARRDDDRGPPESARKRRDLAFRYPELREASDAALSVEPIDLSPARFRDRLGALADRDDWPALADPSRRMVDLEGRDCRGVAHKILDRTDCDSPVPVVVSPGSPPDVGVWAPQRVRAVATAKALAWERGREIPHAIVEYPAHAVVRRVRLTTQNRAAYRETLRTVEAMADRVPARTDDRSKCSSCPYRDPCGPPGRSLRALLDRF